MPTIPLSECQIFAVYGGDWPDLPLSTFAERMGRNTRFGRLGVPDGWLSETVSPVAYFVLGDDVRDVEDEVFWVLTPIAYGCIAPPEQYPGWEKLRDAFLQGAEQLAPCMGRRRLRALYLRYIDEFDASHGEVPDQVLHWPRVDRPSPEPCAQSTNGHLAMADDGTRFRVRTEYVLDTPPECEEAQPAESTEIARFTTTVWRDTDLGLSASLDDTEVLRGALDGLHAWSKYILWINLKEEYRCGAGTKLFDREEVKKFTRIQAAGMEDAS